MLPWLVLVLAFQGGGRSVVETHPAQQVIQLGELPVPGTLRLTIQGGMVERFRLSGATLTLDASVPLRKGDYAIVSYVGADISACASVLEALQPQQRTEILHCPAVSHWSTAQSNCISVWEQPSGRRRV